MIKKDNHKMAQTTSQRNSIAIDDLAPICVTLFGEHWQTPLSRAIDVSDRTVRRWVSAGDAPAFVLDKLLDFIASDRAALDAAEATIKKIQGK